MSATRKAVLKHMMTVPMDLTEKDLPWQWAQSMGLSKISSLVSLKDVTPHATFKDSGGDEQTLSVGEITDINCIIRWVQKEGLSYDWLTKATSDAFEKFQFEDSNPAKSPAAAGATTAVSASSASLPYRSMSKDLKQFKEIHKRYLYNSWIQTVKATAATQGVIHPFDPSYGPTGPEETLIFNEENAYAYLIARLLVSHFF